jgi:hypothetical protein
MALSLSACVPAFAPATPIVAPSAARAAAPVMETIEDLKAMSVKLNPVVGYYNPLSLGETSIGSSYDAEAGIGFLRQAEIKHGRVAMAAFVGFCVQSNGICFPWALTGGPLGDASIMFSDISAAGGPGDQWDALPTMSKLQILGFVGFLEMLSETTYFLNEAGEKHYVNGGKPGFFPPFSKLSLPHPVPLDLFDPFGFTKKMSPERKAKALVAEINNGRLAMIGIFGLLSVSKGLYVPGLDGIDGIKPYSGEYMAPFADGDKALWMVPEMLDYAKTLSFGNILPEGINNYM